MGSLFAQAVCGPAASRRFSNLRSGAGICQWESNLYMDPTSTFLPLQAGTHAQLLQRGGIYAELVRRQTKDAA